VISPLIANLDMNRFLKCWRQGGRGEAWQAHVINYADDFVILSRGYAAEALAWTDQTMARLGLRLNRTKTCMRIAREELFDCQGYSFGPLCVRQTLPRSQSESRMRKTRTSGLTSGKGRRRAHARPRPSSTLLCPGLRA
jgi:hypothetical protein